MRSFYAASCTGQYSSAPDGVLRVFAADESVAYDYPVTTLDEIIKATGDLSVAEKQQLVASLLFRCARLTVSFRRRVFLLPQKSRPCWPKTS
jgi:hypothetical protein